MPFLRCICHTANFAVFQQLPIGATARDKVTGRGCIINCRATLPPLLNLDRRHDSCSEEGVMF